MNFREIQARHLKIVKQGNIKPNKELRSEIHECLMCDNEVDPMEFYKGMPICCACVDYVANVNSYLRSGEFESWQKEKPVDKKYTKKKISHELKKKSLSVMSTVASIVALTWIYALTISSPNHGAVKPR